MILIRPLLIEETTLVRYIAYNSWPHTFGHVLPTEQIDYMLELMYSEEFLRKQIEDKSHKFLLATDDYNPLGFISYELNFKEALYTMIHKLYLLPEVQGKGIGSSLISSVEEISRKTNCRRLQLKVFIRNPKAIQFYESNGFVLMGTEETDIGRNYIIVDYVMDKQI